jgi:phage protein D
MAESHVYEFVVKVDGTELPVDVATLLKNVSVEDNLHLADTFAFTFHDPEKSALSTAGIDFGRKIEISVQGQEGGPEQLVVGEVTALESAYDHVGTRTTVRGFDHSHRLFRGRRTESYLNSTASDIARTVASRAGLQIGQIDPSTGPPAPHVAQRNQNDWTFLKRLASEHDYDAKVEDGKFAFVKRQAASTAPSPSQSFTDNELQLELGGDLLRFHAVVTAADQVAEVQARGWDYKQKQAVVATAPARTTSAVVAVKPDDLAKTFASPPFVAVDVPFGTQAEVEQAAKVSAEQVAGGFAEFYGVARGNPRIKAGTAISVGLAGKPFDGKYTITSTRHVYTPDEGYQTWFTVSGRQERSLLGLTSNGGSAGPGPIAGVAVAIVTDNNDPEQLGRVKLKLPRLSDSFETDWVRMAQPGAGNQRGAVIMPEVNDEVLVAFEHGDIRSPFVVGMLYNGQDKPNLGSGLFDYGKVKRRGFVSKKGSALVFLDDDSKEGVALLSGDKGLRISLNRTKSKIRVYSDGTVEIEGAGDVTVSSGQNLTLKAGQAVKISAGTSLEAKAGTSATLEGSAQVTVKGARADLDGGAEASLHAGIVRIN